MNNMENVKLTPRQEFLDELKKLIDKIDVIDKKVPWQHVEPEWWLEMMEIRRTGYAAIEKFKEKEVVPVLNIPEIFEKIRNGETCIYVNIFNDTPTEKKLFDLMDEIATDGRKDMVGSRDLFFYYLKEDNMWYGNKEAGDMSVVKLSDLC